ncbi:hypothetical protein KG091_00360 [Carnobacteriaceae bacterium zg-ZUI78]|nr:hypothetical protein [Carnobacteriaceae bacterium zg-ZUI78]
MKKYKYITSIFFTFIVICIITACSPKQDSTNIKPLAEGFPYTGTYKATTSKSTLSAIHFENDKMILSLDMNNHASKNDVIRSNISTNIRNQFSQILDKNGKLNKKATITDDLKQEPKEPTLRAYYEQDLPNYQAKYGNMYLEFSHPTVTKAHGNDTDWVVQLHVEENDERQILIIERIDATSFKDNTGTIYKK